MMMSMAVVVTALLFGGMTLYSFGFAAFLFSALPPQTAGATLRAAFPWFYRFVTVTAAASGLLWWQFSESAALLMAVITVTTVLTWKVLMPAINRATDTGLKARFKWLHAASVVVTLTHIGASGWLLAHIA